MDTDLLASFLFLGPPLALIPHTLCDDPFVWFSHFSGLVPSFGLEIKEINDEDHSFELHGKLTGIPHGLTGCTLPFDFPLPPP